MSPRPKGGASWPLQAKRLTSETGNVHRGVEGVHKVEARSK